MAKEKYFYFDEDGVHQFTVTVKEKRDKTTYTLKYSNSGEWVDEYKGVKIARAIDNGDGFDIKVYFDLEDMSHQSQYFEYLYLLLNSVQKINPNLMSKYKLYKSTDITED